VRKSFLVRCLRERWVRPAFPAEGELDAEDLARLRLIVELLGDFGVNEEAVPVILHLLDQLYALADKKEARNGLRRLAFRS
jgi:chaperone modulatory protein CbpM